MQRITFGEFLEKTSTYERMPIRIDPGLRRGVWFSWLVISVLGGIYQFLPSGNYLRAAPFFQWTNGWMSNTWDFVADYRQILVVACGLMFFMMVVLMIPTRFYQMAEISLHAVLFIPVMFSALNLLCGVILILPLIANLLVWVFFIILCILLGMLILTIFFGALTH